MKERIAGIIITLVEVVLSAVFMAFLWSTKMIPIKFLAIIGLWMLVIVMLVLVLTRSPRKKVKFVIGVLLVLLTALGYIGGASYIEKGVSTLTGITENAVEKSEVAIYVRTADKAKKLKDTKGYTYGVLKTLDRKNTDEALKEVKKVIGDTTIKEYQDVSGLVDGLEKTKEVDAIILNNGFMNLLEERKDYKDVKAQMRQIHIEAIKKKVKAAPKVTNGKGLPETFSVYISGIDSRSGLVANSRSDVNIIATVNTKTHRILLVSTPRDFYVPLSISNGVPDKLTHAGIYGVDVSKDTLGMLYKTNIDYYFRLNFSGFEQIIDSLGGITVDSDYSFSVNNGKYSYVKGENHVNGAEALAFARERHSFAEGDRQRGKNQIHVIEGVLKKAMSPALLQNYNETMKSLEGCFETNIPYEVIAGLVRKQLDDGKQWSVDSYSANGTGAKKVPYSMSSRAYVMIPDMNTVNTAIEKMEQVKEGK